MHVPPLQSPKSPFAPVAYEESAWRPLSVVVDSIVHGVEQARSPAPVRPPRKGDLPRAA